jgi:hypothetical protein
MVSMWVAERKESSMATGENMLGGRKEGKIIICHLSQQEISS